jgi:hypothetical protein
MHGDQVDPDALAAFLKFNKLWRPDLRVINGDLWNMVPLRRGASADEQRESMQEDFNKGLQILEEFKPNTLLLGNHDVRLWNLAQKGTGIQRDFANQNLAVARRVCQKLGCNVLPYTNREGKLAIGKLNVMHGFGAGLNMARRMVQAYGSLVLGHLHTIDIVSVEGDHRRMGRISGCLCKLDLEYASTQLANLRWQHGWAYGVYDPLSGNYFVWQAEEVDGQWIVPSDIKEL